MGGVPGGRKRVGSGQVYYSAEVQDHHDEGHNLKAASATSEVTPLESNYAQIVRDDTAEPTTTVAENHSDVPQAATSNLFIRGSPRDHFPNCTRAVLNLFTGLELKQRPARSNLLKRSRY
jgi:hypothetical protein